KYHSNALGTRLRSAIGRRAVQMHEAGAPVLQVGATFHIAAGNRPLFLYCDATAALDASAKAYGFLAHLSTHEIDRIVAADRSLYHKSPRFSPFSEGGRLPLHNN